MSDVQKEMKKFVGRHAEKQWDWNAFSRTDGYAELRRAQMRYVGAGGSPKVDDPDTIKPEHFTLSFLELPQGNYGAMHTHADCEETFHGIQGYTSVGWAFDDEAVVAKVGPKDLLWQPIGRPHAYKNVMSEPVMLSIMVGSGKPLPPVIHTHPDSSPYAATFGATPDKVIEFSSRSEDPRIKEYAKHLVRYSQQKIHAHSAGFGYMKYVGGDGAAVPAVHYREDLIHLPAGKGVKTYEREVEDVYLVFEGLLTVGWEEDGKVVEQQIGPRDIIFNPPGRKHYFRNDGLDTTQFMMVTGTRTPETVKFQAA